MARYRLVFTEIWVCDDKFQDYSPEGKLIFLYLITNDHLNESGVYKITYKTISNETDVPKSKVQEVIKGELSNNVSYDEDNNVVFVHQFLKFNGGGNPELVKKSIEKDRKLVKTSLWKQFDNHYTTDLKPIEKPSKKDSSNSISIANAKPKEKNMYEKSFETLWKSWPEEGRFKKKICRMKFNVLCKAGKLEEFQKTTHGYSDYLRQQKERRNFDQQVMHLSTWLNNWEEEKEQYINFKYEPPL